MATLRLHRKARPWIAALVAAPVVLAGPWLYMRAVTVWDTTGIGETPDQADAALVLGARVYDDGTASQHLAQRVALAVELYDAGIVEVLVMSGDGSDGANDEPGTMRALAEQAGVPADAIVEDPAGVDTRASCDNTEALLSGGGAADARVIVVTNEYHVARATWLCDQAGLDARGHHTVIGGGKGTFTGNLREVLAAWKAVLGS